MLISPVIPLISIYKLPHGQYGYSGHVINLPQDVSGFINSLPCHPSELDIILVKNPGMSQSHHDFRVRRSVVFRALQFLIANNIYFKSITINPDNLSLLPDDDGIFTVHILTIEYNSESAFNNPDNTEDSNNDHLTTTFIPGNYQSNTEEENIRRPLDESSSISSAVP